MKPIRNLLITVTLFLAVYAAMPPLGASYDLVFTMFIIGNALLLYLVYSILKKGVEPKEKFDDGYWYSDIDKQYSKERIKKD